MCVGNEHPCEPFQPSLHLTLVFLLLNLQSTRFRGVPFPLFYFNVMLVPASPSISLSLALCISFLAAASIP